MDDKLTSPELSRVELLPAQEEHVPANPPSRKRQLDSDDDAEPQAKRAQTTQPTSEPARLTRKNLARFNKMNNNSGPSDDSGSTKTLSTTASGFDIQALKNGILDASSSKPPINLEDIHKRLAKTRATVSPPESVYEEYVELVEGAPNEATMVHQVGAQLLKRYSVKGYKKVFNQAFTAYPKDVGFNNGLSAPQPDFVEGIEMRDYLPFPVDERVPGAVLYKDDRRSVTLPHIAGEWKGPGGKIKSAELQSAYDGAALVFARNQALESIGRSDPPGHANVTTFTTDGSYLNLYAHYATTAEDGKLEYHQFRIESTSLLSSHQAYKEGRKKLRNEQDHAKNQSYALRDQLKEHYNQQHNNGLHPVAKEAPSLPRPGIEPLDSSVDKVDGEAIEPRPIYQPAPPMSSKHKDSKTTSHHAPISPSSGHKRKTPSSPQSSHGSSQGSFGCSDKYKRYWKKDPTSGRYYHKHTNGAISWLEDDEEDECD